MCYFSYSRIHSLSLEAAQLASAAYRDEVNLGKRENPVFQALVIHEKRC